MFALRENYPNKTATHDCDVLVIGGGLAGVLAAIKARQSVESVILVEQGKVAKSGCSPFAAGVMTTPQIGDDFDAWAKEIVSCGWYLNDQEWVKIMLNEMPKIVDDLQSWGVEFEKDAKGNLARILGRGHIETKLAMFHGPQFMETLRKVALSRKVILVERVMINELLVSDGRYPTDGRIAGAAGFQVRTGQFHVFRARAVVLATGGIMGRQGTCVGNLTGDGIAMAYRTGAELYNMEFHAAAEGGWCFERKILVQGFNMWQGHGCQFVNASGERFMKKYAPVLQERAQIPELQLGMAKEGIEGRGPVYIDMRHFSTETWDKFRRVIPNFMQAAEKLKPWDRKIQFDIVSTAIAGLIGGVRDNIYCETTIPGLFVAGQVDGFPTHGAMEIGGTNLTACCVAGYRAGEFAPKYARTLSDVKIDEAYLEKIRDRIYQPLSIKNGMTPAEIEFRAVESAITSCGLFKNETKVKKVLEGLAKAKELLPQVRAEDYHDLVYANKMKNFVPLMELAYKAALIRTESRAAHYRTEYPYRDDVNWLKWIIWRWEGDDKVSIRLESVPIYRYPAKPEKLARVPSPVPPPAVS